MQRRHGFPISILAAAGLLAGCAALAACGSRGAGGGGGDSVGAEGNLSGETGAVETARLEARADIALRRALPEAPSRYENVRAGVGGAICGELETLPSLTEPVGMRPFIVNRDGEAFVSSGPGLRLEDPADPFPDLYMQWCATPDELESIRQRLQAMRPADVRVALPPTANLAAPPETGDENPTEETPPAPAPPPPPPPRTPRPSGDESFYNSVVRPPHDP